MPIEVPAALAETQRAEGGAWVRNLPALIEEQNRRAQPLPNQPPARQPPAIQPSASEMMP